MNLLEKFSQITCFIFDVDGVLTDGMLFLFNTGEQARCMNIQDGYALQLAIKKGYRIAVFSGAKSEAAERRLNKLGITDVFMGVENKRKSVEDFLVSQNIQWKNVLFMGDDIPDYVVMQQAGLACAPANAAPEIKQISKYISSATGGHGCVRDVIEKVMKLRGDWVLDTEIPSK